MRHFVLGALLATALVATHVLAQPSANVGDYVLVADRELNARDLTVISGDVAVSSGALKSHSGLQADSSRVAADQVDIDPRSTCDALFANVVVDAGGGCGPAAPLTSPLFADLASACGFPANPAACAASQPVSVRNKETRTLPPGVYGDLFVAGGSPGRGTLVLEGGSYVFCNVHIGPRARVFARGAVSVQIANEVNFGLGSFTGPATSSGLQPDDVAFFVAGGEARFQRRADLVGRICVPNGRLWFMHGSSLDGCGFADSIKTGRVTVRLGCEGSGVTTTTTSSSTSSTAVGTTSTSTTIGGTTSTSTTSVPSSSTTSTTGVVPSTTSTSTTSTTSTTGQIPTTSSSSSTSTTTTSTSSTSAQVPTTSSTSSTTSSTAVASVCGNGMTEGLETCDDGNTVNADGCPADCVVDACDQVGSTGGVLTVNIVNNESGQTTFGVATVFIDYPEGKIWITGAADDSQVQGAITDRPSTGSPTCLVNDRNHGVQFGCLSTSGFNEGLFFRINHSDCNAVAPPALNEFTCQVLEASDPIGFPVSATCTLSYVAP